MSGPNLFKHTRQTDLHIISFIWNIGIRKGPNRQSGAGVSLTNPSIVYHITSLARRNVQHSQARTNLKNKKHFLRNKQLLRCNILHRTNACANHVIGTWKKLSSPYNSPNHLDMCPKRGVVRKSCERAEIGNYFQMKPFLLKFFKTLVSIWEKILGETCYKQRCCPHFKLLCITDRTHIISG